jgi:hypothetical protein
MRNIIPKIITVVIGLMLLSCVACLASGNGFDKPLLLDPFSSFENTIKTVDVFHLQKNYFQIKGLSFVKLDFAPAFIELLNNSLAEQGRFNQQKLFTLDRERSAYLYSIGSQDRPLSEQLDFLKQQLKKKQQEEAQNSEANKQ